MKVTITVELAGRIIEVAREAPDPPLYKPGSGGDDFTVDALLISGDRDVRKALDLPRHYDRALRFVAGLPHPDSEVAKSWHDRRLRTLTDFVDDVQPIVSRRSAGAPPPAAEGGE